MFKFSHAVLAHIAARTPVYNDIVAMLADADKGEALYDFMENEKNLWQRLPANREAVSPLYRQAELQAISLANILAGSLDSVALALDF